MFGGFIRMSTKALIQFIDDKDNDYFSMIKTYDGHAQNMIPNYIKPFLAKTKNLDIQLLCIEFIQYIKELEQEHYDPQLSLRLVNMDKDNFKDTDALFVYRISNEQLKDFKWILKLDVFKRDYHKPKNLQWDFYSGYAIYADTKKLYDIYGNNGGL